MSNTKKILAWSAGLIVGYFIYIKLKSSGLGSGTSSKQDSPINSGVTQGLNFKSMADTIYEALDGYGSSFDPIMSQFSKLQNNSDLDALYDAYGTRTVSSGRGNIFVSDYTGDMFGALRADLSKTELSKINSYLLSKNIKTI